MCACVAKVRDHAIQNLKEEVVAQRAMVKRLWDKTLAYEDQKLQTQVNKISWWGEEDADSKDEEHSDEDMETVSVWGPESHNWFRDETCVEGIEEIEEVEEFVVINIDESGSITVR